MFINHLEDIKKGVGLGITTLLRIVQNKELHAPLLRILLWILGLLLMVQVIVRLVLSVPVLLLSLFGLHFDLKELDYAVVLYVQNVVMLSCRYVYPTPLDTLFYKSMYEYATVTRNERAIHSIHGLLNRLEFKWDFVRKRIFQSIKRSMRRGIFLLGVFLMSKVPLFGHWVIPCVTIYYAQSRLGSDVALLVLLSHISPLKVKWPLQQLTLLRQCVLEVLEPVTIRFKIKGFKKIQWVIMGIIGIYYPFLGTILGPFVFCLLLSVVGYSYLEFLPLPE
jgi:hypothetical protein